ncbi:MAG: ATPase, E1-E2 type:Copper-translocating P-type ATPase:Heavy metal translocating P-type ATPase, partial [Candidatus Collierbacteria bacterium GW2011_GWB1_44_6]
MTKTTVPVIGMDCASCSNIVNRAIKKTPGVISSNVSIASNKADIEFDQEKTTLEKINANVKEYGYSLNLTPPDQMTDHMHHTGEEHVAMLKKQITILFPVSLIVFFLMLWDALSRYAPGFPMFIIPMNIFNTVLAVLSTLTLLFFGREFLAAIPRFAKTKVANMDTLIGIGSVAAYLYSLFVIFLPDMAMSLKLPETTYFDVVIVVIGFIKFGKYLEANSKQKTGQAIKELLKLSAKVALIERSGKEIEIGIDAVQIGDTVIVKPGAKIPVDGKIIEGHTSIDESMITGEPIPVDKSIGDLVTSGTINNQGYIKFRAEKVGSSTLLSQIIKMVENAQGSKAPIEKLADTISAYFVPAVLGLALLAFLIWFLSGNLSLAISAFVGILVIACPCALGLATPTAIIVGVGKGAQNGILVKDAEVLEKLHNINTVVFDKTGTITTGKPVVSTVISTSKQSEEEIISILASLEKQSAHPLAQAIVNYAHHPSLRGANATKQSIKIHTIQNFKDIPGKGISGQFKNKRYLAGNMTLLKEHKVDYDEKDIKEYTSKGMTPVFLISGQSLLGAVFISDTLKNESRQAISDLHKMGVKTVMLTGDDHDTAAYIAREAGIDRIYAQVLPGDKARIINQIKVEGNKVAMVGDGVNDSPALATADVGIAIGAGTNVAIESAGIILFKSDPRDIVKIVRLSRLTYSKMLQNLFWATG